MKVSANQLNSQLNVGSAKGQKTGRAGKSADGVSPQDLAASAKVNISSRAQMINKAKELATPDMDGVREDRVAHFQNLIDSGKYSVDASAVADRLVDEHLI